MAIGIFITFLVMLAAVVTTVITLLVIKPRVGVIVLLSAICVITVGVLTLRLIYKPRLTRFANEVKAVINPNDLQQWALLTLSKADVKSFEIPLKDVPTPIQKIRTDDCTIEMAFFSEISPKSENTCIHLVSCNIITFAY
jgi:hypothetical protein